MTHRPVHRSTAFVLILVLALAGSAAARSGEPPEGAEEERPASEEQSAEESGPGPGDPEADDPEASRDDFPAVDAYIDRLLAEIEAREREFATQPAAPDDKEWVQRKLAHMVEVDQLLRSAFVGLTYEEQEPLDLSAEERQELTRRLGPRLGATDEANTAELAALLDRHGWFNLSDWGEEADGDAWLLTQHADRDPEFQQRVLELLEPLYRSGETQPRNYAYLYDRVHARNDSNGNQRYGTQGQCTEPGVWEPFPLEQPEKVDELRAEVGLGPLEEYKQRVVRFCG